LILADDSYKMI